MIVKTRGSANLPELRPVRFSQKALCDGQGPRHMVRNPLHADEGRSHIIFLSFAPAKERSKEKQAEIDDSPISVSLPIKLLNYCDDEHPGRTLMPLIIAKHFSY